MPDVLAVVAHASDIIQRIGSVAHGGPLAWPVLDWVRHSGGSTGSTTHEEPARSSTFPMGRRSERHASPRFSINFARVMPGCNVLSLGLRRYRTAIRITSTRTMPNLVASKH
jgi:hypothetical protein